MRKCILLIRKKHDPAFTNICPRIYNSVTTDSTKEQKRIETSTDNSTITIRDHITLPYISLQNPRGLLSSIGNHHRGSQACRGSRRSRSRRINTKCNPSKQSFRDISSKVAVENNWIPLCRLLLEDSITLVRSQRLLVIAVRSHRGGLRDERLVEEELANVVGGSAIVVSVGCHLSVAMHEDVNVRSATGVPPGEVGGELCDALSVGVLKAAVGGAENIVSVRGADTVATNGNAAVDTGGVGV